MRTKENVNTESWRRFEDLESVQMFGENIGQMIRGELWDADDDLAPKYEVFGMI